MTRVKLVHLAHARSGDKGDTANVGIIAYDPQDFDLLREQLTTERVKAHFGELVQGDVERFELPNLHALNFLLHNALDGGGTVSLMNDAQGKVMSTALLRMELDVPESVAQRVRGRGRAPEARGPGSGEAADGKTLSYSVNAGVGTILLNRPEKKNALDSHLVLALQVGLSRAVSDNRTSVIAVRGAGADFCAGGDLGELAQLQQLGPEQNLADAKRLGDLLLQLRHCRKPVVAVVQGRALAGGCGLATACDIVLAHENAEFGYPEVHLGFVPAMVMAILRRKVMEVHAFELIARGDRISAQEAARIGLVTRVFPAATFEADVSAYIESLAQRPPTALVLTKRLFYGLDGTSVEEGVARGAEVNTLARLTDACKEGVRKFLERSRPS